MKKVLSAFLLSTLANAASAQEFVVGVGYTDFGYYDAKNTALVVAEYHHKPFFETDRFNLHWAAGLTLHTSGDAQIGLGLASVFDLNRRWFLEVSVLPGAYLESSDRNFLGGRFQIRSLLGLGYTFASGNRLSLGISHISNAGTSNYNPGVNAAILRFRRRF